MKISILGSKKTSDTPEFLLNSYPLCGIIRTTADYFLLPSRLKCTKLDTINFFGNIIVAFLFQEMSFFNRQLTLVLCVVVLALCHTCDNVTL
jgi:hypothetical protein